MSEKAVLAFRWIFETGDERRIRKLDQRADDLNIIKDIPYFYDGDRGHLFDIYSLKDADENSPVIINIHGGGLFASYKEVNMLFNYEWARKGYKVVSLSYRRIPDTTLIHQVEDVMNGIRFIACNADKYKLNLSECFLTGDSAGALLSFFVMSVNSSKKLQCCFGMLPTGIDFKASALISIMLDTQRNDIMKAINDAVTDGNDEGKPYLPYILNPAKCLEEAALPPVYLVTGEQDLIQKDTLKLDMLLKGKHVLKNYPKGKERKLDHVFSVKFPKYPESVELFEEIDGFFKGEL